MKNEIRMTQWQSALSQVYASEQDPIPPGFIDSEEACKNLGLRRSRGKDRLNQMVKLGLVERIQLMRQCSAGGLRKTAFYRPKKK